MPDRSIGILGTGIYVPERVLTNFDLEKMVDTSDQWIRERSGIIERRIAAPEESVASLATQASRHALEAAGIAAADLSYIIVGTNSPDYVFPSIAIRVQRDLDLDGRLGAFDVLAGCSGFNYALYIAERLVKPNGGYALVIGSDANSRMINWQDRSTCVLFGDGAGAAVVGPTARSRLVASFIASRFNDKLYLSTEFNHLNSPFLPPTPAPKNYMYMDGPEIYKFAINAVRESLRRLLEAANMKREEIDFLIIHQGNYRILETGARFARVPMDKVYVNIDRYGNTSAASVPIALHEALQEGKIKAGHKVVMISFGAGVTWAGNVVEWSG
ncbi:MAG: ketoacyl-ACP synthase III [Deltaproteobacteria bacterium]|nr:ketoacyl-ACP synthase III [Deltaproteobacteria bacterium]